MDRTPEARLGERPGGEMRKAERPFHHQVEELKQRVARMAELSRRSILEGVDAFARLDAGAAERVIRLNDDINRMDVEIEKETLDLLALHQPMASDLRTLGACLKIITYTDRIGRYGYDIAKAVHFLEGKQHLRKLVSIPHMADLAAAMLDQAVAGFLERDAAKAQDVYAKDDVVDALYEQIFRESLTYMVEDPRTITQCAQYILVARHLERAGDNACKIAEKTIYMVKGERRLQV